MIFLPTAVGQSIHPIPRGTKGIDSALWLTHFSTNIQICDLYMDLYLNFHRNQKIYENMIPSAVKHSRPWFGSFHLWKWSWVNCPCLNASIADQRLGEPNVVLEKPPRVPDRNIIYGWLMFDVPHLFCLHPMTELWCFPKRNSTSRSIQANTSHHWLSNVASILNKMLKYGGWFYKFYMILGFPKVGLHPNPSHHPFQWAPSSWGKSPEVGWTRDSWHPPCKPGAEALKRPSFRRRFFHGKIKQLSRCSEMINGLVGGTLRRKPMGFFPWRSTSTINQWSLIRREIIEENGGLSRFDD